MKIIIISIHNWALHYLKESLNNSQLKKTTLITDKLTNEIKKFLSLNNIKYLVTKNLTIKNCNDLSCAIETPAPVEFCFLYDGTSPQDKFFKIGNSNLDLILKVNKTGYVEY